VLAVIVALLVAIIIWIFRRGRSRPAPLLQVPAARPAVVEPTAETSSSPWVYKAPTPMAQELSGNAAQGQVYEADPVHRVELDTR
jgi:hypothetical protein